MVSHIVLVECSFFIQVSSRASTRCPVSGRKEEHVDKGAVERSGRRACSNQVPLFATSVRQRLTSRRQSISEEGGCCSHRLQAPKRVPHPHPLGTTAKVLARASHCVEG